MILQDGQEICIDGRWYRGGDFVPIAEPSAPQTIDDNDVKNIETDTETVEVPQKKGRK